MSSDGAAAHALLHRLAEVLLRAEQRPSALILPFLEALEEQMALRQPQLQTEAAEAGATASTIVAAVIKECHVLQGGRGFAAGPPQRSTTSASEELESIGAPLADHAIIDSFATQSFRELVNAVSLLDADSETGRRLILEAAFGSRCAIVIRLLFCAEKSLARRHPLLGLLLNLRLHLPQYFGYCQAVDLSLQAVPERAERWMWAMPDGTDRQMMNQFLKLEETAPNRLFWLEGPSGALALHSLLRSHGKATFRTIHPLDYFCNRETLSILRDFVHRTFVAGGAPSEIAAPDTGFTVKSWCDFYEEYLAEAFSLDSIKEQVQWCYYGYVRCIQFFVYAQNEMRIFINSPAPASARLVKLAPLDASFARDLTTKREKLAHLRDHRDHFDWMRPQGSSSPMDPHLLPLLSSNIHLLHVEDQAAARSVKPSKLPASSSSDAIPSSKKQKRQAAAASTSSATASSAPGSQASSVLWLSASLLLVSNWVWNVPKVAGDFGLDLKARCWSTVLSAKLGDNKLANCTNPSAHGGMKGPLHRLIPGFNAADPATRAKYGRAPTREEIARLQKKKAQGQSTSSTPAKPTSQPTSSQSTPPPAAAPPRAPVAGRGRTGRGRGRGGRGRGSLRGGGVVSSSRSVSFALDPPLEDGGGAEEEEALLEAAAEADLHEIVTGSDAGQENASSATAFLAAVPPDLGSEARDSLSAPLLRGGGRAPKKPPNHLRNPREFALELVTDDIIPALSIGQDLPEPSVPEAWLEGTGNLCWAMQPFARAVRPLGYFISDRGGEGRCGFNSVARALALLGHYDSSLSDKELGERLRAEACDHAENPATLAARLSEDAAASVGESTSFASALVTSLAAWLTADMMVSFDVTEFSVETWLRLMRRDSTYMDTAMLLVIADLKRALIVVETIDEHGVRTTNIGGSAHVLRPRQGVEPVMTIRLLCQTDAHFTLIVKLGPHRPLDDFALAVSRRPPNPIAVGPRDPRFRPPSPRSSLTFHDDLGYSRSVAALPRECSFWDMLTRTEQLAARMLGFDQLLWDNGVSPPETRRLWSELRPTLRSAAELLGYVQASWDAEWLGFQEQAALFGVPDVSSESEATTTAPASPCPLEVIAMAEPSSPSVLTIDSADVAVLSPLSSRSLGDSHDTEAAAWWSLPPSDDDWDEENSSYHQLPLPADALEPRPVPEHPLAIQTDVLPVAGGSDRVTDSEGEVPTLSDPPPDEVQGGEAPPPSPPSEAPPPLPDVDEALTSNLRLWEVAHEDAQAAAALLNIHEWLEPNAATTFAAASSLPQILVGGAIDSPPPGDAPLEQNVAPEAEHSSPLSASPTTAENSAMCVYETMTEMEAVEFNSFSWPLRSVEEVQRLLQCEHIAPTDLVGFEFSGAVRSALEQQGRWALSVDFRPCEKGGMHAMMDVRLVVSLRVWERAFFFPPCFQQLRADEDCLPFKKSDGRAFWGCVTILYALYAVSAHMIVVEQPDTIFSDYHDARHVTFRTSAFGDAPDKFVRLFMRNTTLQIPTAFPLCRFRPPNHLAYANPEARDRAKSTWAYFPTLCAAIAAMQPTRAGRPVDKRFQSELVRFARAWHDSGLAVPADFDAPDGRPTSARARDYQLVRGAGDGRIVKRAHPSRFSPGDVTSMDSSANSTSSPPEKERAFGLADYSSADVVLFGFSEEHGLSAALLVVGSRPRSDPPAQAISELREPEDTSPLFTALRGVAEELLGLEGQHAVTKAEEFERSLASAHYPSEHLGRSPEAKHRAFAVPANLIFKGGIDDALASFRSNDECIGAILVPLQQISGAPGETEVTDVLGTEYRLRDQRHLGSRRVAFMQRASNPTPIVQPRGGGYPAPAPATEPTPNLNLPTTLDYRTLSASMVVLLFIATLVQPLVFAHVNGFTVHGVELPDRPSRTNCLGTAQKLVSAAVGAGHAAFMIGEYVDGARLVAAPIDFAPSPREVCRTPRQRMKFLASGAAFVWCTLAALSGTPIADPTARAFASAEAFIKPVSRLADFQPSISGSPCVFRFGAAESTSVLARPTLDHVDSPPGWRAFSLDASFAALLGNALEAAEAIGDSLVQGLRTRIFPLDVQEIPESLMSALPTFTDDLLEHQAFSKIPDPLVTDWVSLPPIQPSPDPMTPNCVESPLEMLYPTARDKLKGWLHSTLLDLLHIQEVGAEAEKTRSRPQAIAIGQSEMYPWARGRVWDCRGRCCRVADFRAPITTHLNLEYLHHRLRSYPDQYLLANLLEGVRLDADTELHSVFIPHLVSLPAGYASVSKELRRLHKLDWYDFFPDLPWWPLYCNGRGSTVKKHSFDDDGLRIRRPTTEGGGPRYDVFDESGLRALSINEASHIHHMPRHFAEDTRPEMVEWLRSRGLPPSDVEVGALLSAGSKWPKEVKPYLENVMHDLAILRRAAAILGEPIFVFTDDIKDFFNQLAIAECDLHKLNFIFLAESQDDIRTPDRHHLPQTEAAQLLFVSERRLGFGTHGASNIAQRFSDAVLALFRQDLDAEEQELVFDQPMSEELEQWVRARREVAKRLCADAEKDDTPSCPCEELASIEQRRLYAAYIYTDDGLFITVGVERTLRALKAWRRLTGHINLLMAAPEKRGIGTHVLWLGVLIIASLGVVVVPRDKLLRAADGVQRALLGGMPFREYRALCGLLEHLRAINLRGRNVMHGLYAPHQPTGASRFGPEGRVFCDELMVKQLQRWQHLLAQSAGVSVRSAFSKDAVEPVTGLIAVACADACFGEVGRRARHGDPSGIGGFCHGHYWYFPISEEDEEFLSTTSAEFLAYAFDIIIFAERLSTLCGSQGSVLIRTDSLTTALTLPRASQHSPVMVDIYQLLWQREELHRLLPILRVAHVFGDCNPFSDKISRSNWKGFFSLCRQMHIFPVRIEVPDPAISLFKRVVALEKMRRVRLAANRAVEAHRLSVPAPRGGMNGIERVVAEEFDLNNEDTRLSRDGNPCAPILVIRPLFYSEASAAADRTRPALWCLLDPVKRQCRVCAQLHPHDTIHDAAEKTRVMVFDCGGTRSQCERACNCGRSEVNLRLLCPLCHDTFCGAHVFPDIHRCTGMISVESCPDAHPALPTYAPREPAKRPREQPDEEDVSGLYTSFSSRPQGGAIEPTFRLLTYHPRHLSHVQTLLFSPEGWDFLSKAPRPGDTVFVARDPHLRRPLEIGERVFMTMPRLDGASWWMPPQLDAPAFLVTILNIFSEHTAGWFTGPWPKKGRHFAQSRPYMQICARVQMEPISTTCCDARVYSSDVAHAQIIPCVPVRNLHRFPACGRWEPARLMELDAQSAAVLLHNNPRFSMPRSDDILWLSRGFVARIDLAPSTIFVTHNDSMDCVTSPSRQDYTPQAHFLRKSEKCYRRLTPLGNALYQQYHCSVCRKSLTWQRSLTDQEMALGVCPSCIARPPRSKFDPFGATPHCLMCQRPMTEQRPLSDHELALGVCPTCIAHDGPASFLQRFGTAHNPNTSAKKVHSAPGTPSNSPTNKIRPVRNGVKAAYCPTRSGWYTLPEGAIGWCDCMNGCLQPIYPADRSTLCDFCFEGCQDSNLRNVDCGCEEEDCCLGPLPFRRSSVDPQQASVCEECPQIVNAEQDLPAVGVNVFLARLTSPHQRIIGSQQSSSVSSAQGATKVQLPSHRSATARKGSDAFVRRLKDSTGLKIHPRAPPRPVGRLLMPAPPPQRFTPRHDALEAAHSHYARLRAIAFQGGPDPSMQLRGNLSDLCAIGDAVAENTDFGTNVNTLRKDDRAWEMWENVCKSVSTSPFRTADDVRSNPERNAFLLCVLMLHATAVCIPRTVGRFFIKPRSALAYPLAIIRIFARWGVMMPGFKSLKAQLHGLMRQYVAYHGPHSLAPQRAEPMKFSMVNDINNIPLDSGLVIGGYQWTSNNRDVFMFRVLNLFMIVTAFRLGEIVLHASREIMYITYGCVYIILAGVVYLDPTPEQLRSMMFRRDKVCIVPPRSKSDQFGEIHCPFPVTLTLDDAPDNAAAAIIALLLSFPCPTGQRDTTPLFSDHRGQPYTHSKLDGMLRAVLTHLYGARVAALYTWHSYRSGLATALHAAGVPDPIIQLICRWMCPESLLVYRRLGTAENERHVASARRVPVEALQTANAPRIDAAPGYAEIVKEFSNTRLARNNLFDFESARDTQNGPRPFPTIDTERQDRPSRGRRVLIPSDLWPTVRCHENDGRGWEGEVRSETGLTALVRFVNARTPDGRPYMDERLPLDRLQPFE